MTSLYSGSTGVCALYNVHIIHDCSVCLELIKDKKKVVATAHSQLRTLYTNIYIFPQKAGSFLFMNFYFSCNLCGEFRRLIRLNSYSKLELH